MRFYYLFLACFYWLFHLPFSFGKIKESQPFSRQNKSFFFPKYRPEIFYDNKVLVEDVEVDVFLIKGQLQRLFYLLEGSYRPLTITVTPCSSSALEWGLSHQPEWRLSHQPLPISSSGTNYREDYSHVYGPQSVLSTALTTTYSGTERRSYTNSLAPPGLYILEMESSENTQAKVVVTTRSCTDYSYHPVLPSMKTVQIVKAKRNRVLISWKPSISRKPVEYCVTSNARTNYDSFCSAQHDLLSSYPISPPPNAGFGFHWEKTPKKAIMTNFVSDAPKNNASLICVGRKTWHMFRGLERGKTYYFDVFAIDAENNASTSYVGTKTMIKSSHRHSLIKEDTLVTFLLEESNGYTVTAKYAAGKNIRTIFIFVQSCTGPGPVAFTVTKHSPAAKPEEILSERIMDVKTLEVHENDTNNNSFAYVVNFKPTTKVSRKVRIWISSRKHHFPYPIMPSDKNVKVFDTLITCNSITIGWKTSPDEKVKYCIYRSPASDDRVQKTLTEPQNTCHTSVETSDSRITVLCRRYHRFSKRRFNNVIIQRVRGLTPGTMYLFEVQVTKTKGKMLPYGRVWASTRDTCSRGRNKR